MENGGLNKNQYHSIMGRGNVRIKNLVKGLSFDLAASRKYGFHNQRVERHFLLWNGASAGHSARMQQAPSASTPTTRTPSPGR